MTTAVSELIPKDFDEEILSKIFLTGDLAGLSQQQKWDYTKAMCQRLGLDPFTRPFRILRNKKTQEETLYATKACGEQLIKIHNITTRPGNVKIIDAKGIAKCSCRAIVPGGRQTKASAYVPIDYYDAAGQLKLIRGEELCNALMKCETKAVQRSVLRINGLGMISELELETIANAEDVSILDQEQMDRGNLLTQTNRKQALEWYRAGKKVGFAKDYETLEQAAHDCLGSLHLYATGSNMGEAKEARDKAIAEVVEVFTLEDQEVERRKGASKKTKDKNEAKKQIDAPPTPTDATNITASIQADSPIENVVAEADKTEIDTSPKETTSSSLSGSTASGGVPSIKELLGKKKPLNAKVETKLDSVLQTIHQERSNLVEREDLETFGQPAYPNPGWEYVRGLLKQITKEAGWTDPVVAKALKEKHKLHADNFNDPAVMTWDKAVELCTWFATHDPASFKAKD